MIWDTIEAIRFQEDLITKTSMRRYLSSNSLDITPYSWVHGRNINDHGIYGILHIIQSMFSVLSQKEGKMVLEATVGLFPFTYGVNKTYPQGCPRYSAAGLRLVPVDNSIQGVDFSFFTPSTVAKIVTNRDKVLAFWGNGTLTLEIRYLPGKIEEPIIVPELSGKNVPFELGGSFD